MVGDVLKNCELLISSRRRLERLVIHEFKLKNWPRKLQAWWTMDFDSFIDAIPKRVTMSQKDDAIDLWSKYQPVVSDASTAVARLLDSIDREVYRLYSLSESEISLVEASLVG